MAQREARQLKVHRVITAAVLGLTALTMAAPAASAARIPVVVTNVAFCAGQYGQPVTTDRAACNFAVEPSFWTSTGDGSWSMTNVQWTSWGAYSAKGIATIYVNTCACAKNVRFQANVTFSFPVEWDGHLVYAAYSAFPTTHNDALFDEDMKYSVGNGFAL